MLHKTMLLFRYKVTQVVLDLGRNYEAHREIIGFNFAACAAAVRAWDTYPGQEGLVKDVVGEKAFKQFGGFRFKLQRGEPRLGWNS